MLLMLIGLTIWPVLGLAFDVPIEGMVVSMAVVMATAISIPVTLLGMHVAAYLFPISFGTLKSATLRTAGLLAFSWSSLLLLLCLQIVDPMGWVCAACPVLLAVNLYLFARMFDFNLLETLTCLVVFAAVEAGVSRIVDFVTYLPTNFV